MTHQNKAMLFCFKILNMKFAFWLDFPPQPTGMPLVPSWSCRPCRALLESSLGYSRLPTFQPSRGSIAPLLLASCSSFQVSGGCIHEWSGSNDVQAMCTVITDLVTGLNKKMCFSLCPVPKLSLFCLQWLFTRGWQWTSWASALATGVSPGRTY